MDKTGFVDYIRLFCHSGKGGAGSHHFLRTRFNPKAGPDGGNGGRGGHIILKGNSHLWTLLHLRYHKNILAENGENGSRNNSTGKNGKDIIIEVPLGTIAKDEITGKIEAELLEDGQEVVWLQGGRGGLGNTNFKSATNQAPEYAQSGEHGIEGYKFLELKMLADVGLVGFPNAGKSTLLSSLSAAKPKIANYPFTTLVPQLGIISWRDQKSFCMADLPGIIEGAAEGKGLGHRFLRHIERNALLLIVIPADSPDHVEEYKVLMKELQAYNPELLHKKRLIGISKSDMLDSELKAAITAELPADASKLFFSAVTGESLSELKDYLWYALQDA